MHALHEAEADIRTALGGRPPIFELAELNRIHRIRKFINERVRGILDFTNSMIKDS